MLRMKSAATIASAVLAAVAGIRVAARQDASSGAGPIMIVENVAYTRAGDDERAITLTAAFPRAHAGGPLPVVVYLHGGRWSAGAKEDGRAVTELFARGGYFAVTVDYRLAGEAKFPAAVQDVKAAIRFLRRNAEPLGIDPDRIGIWGHAAGGHLAALSALSANTPSLEGDIRTDGVVVSSAVACAANVSGPGDLLRDDFNEAGRGIIAGWLGAADGPRARALARQASPVTHADEADPPILIIHGTNDPLVPIAQARSFHERLREAGVASELFAAPDAEHHIDDAIVLPRVAAFFDRHLGGGAAAAIETPGE